MKSRDPGSKQRKSFKGKEINVRDKQFSTRRNRIKKFT